MVVGKTFAEVYQSLAREILEHGDEVAPRGMKTKELVQETFCIEDPTMNLSYIPNRKFSLMHAIAESLLLVAKEERLACYTLMNPTMARFSDNGETLHGAYGYRIADRIQDCVEKLRNDHDTRQAVLTIHRVADVYDKSKDIPCTIALQFTIRHGHLNMHVYMRSNDIVWGTPYDVFVFTNLQMIMANELHIPIGKYYHTATSLHAYEDQFETLELIARNPGRPIGHRNKNSLYDWKCMANIFCGIATHKFDKWHQAICLKLLDNDGSYAFAILMELAYKDHFHDGAADAFLDNGAVTVKTDKSKEWLYNFSKRWCKLDA